MLRLGKHRKFSAIQSLCGCQQHGSHLFKLSTKAVDNFVDELGESVLKARVVRFVVKLRKKWANCYPVVFIDFYSFYKFLGKILI